MSAETHSISQDEVAAIFHSPSIDSILPYQFRNGTTVNEFRTSCDSCGGEISEENIHITITYETASCLAFRGSAVCHREGCHLIGLYEVRFSDDGTFLVKTRTGWTEHRLQTKDCGGCGGKLKGFLGSLKRIVFGEIQ